MHSLEYDSFLYFFFLFLVLVAVLLLEPASLLPAQFPFVPTPPPKVPLLISKVHPENQENPSQVPDVVTSDRVSSTT